jgi:hypothetical protein
MPQATDKPVAGTQRSDAAGRLRLPGRDSPAAACPISPNATWGFDATEPAAVPLCRMMTRAILVTWGLGEHEALVDDVELVVSELTANVYRHVHTSLATVALTWCDSILSARVHDPSSVLPHALPGPREDGSGWDWTGRGLALVETIAAGYGGSMSALRDPDGYGKSVGVALPVKQHRMAPE